jgi:hypothetical protein
VLKLICFTNHRDGGGIVGHVDVELAAHFVCEVIDGGWVGKQEVAQQRHLS